MRRPKATSPCLALAAPLALALAGCGDVEWINPVPDFVAGDLVVLKRNGGWCWFQDPRAVVDRGRILVGTVAGATAFESKRGDIEVTAFDPASGASTTFKLHEELEGDDHDAPSLLVLPDGRYLAMYTRHARDHLMRWRVSTGPGDLDVWAPEQLLKVDDPDTVTYTNTFTLSAEANRVYNFFRGSDYDPLVMTSTPDVAGFTLAGRLLRWDKTAATGVDPAKISGLAHRTSPYLRYASSGVDTIHFVTTEDHPVAYDNSIYHGYVRGGVVYDSMGEVVDGDLFDDDAPSPVDFTRVFAGDADHVAWPTDLELDASGHPIIAFSVQRDGAEWRGTKGNGGLDHRYHYARFDGHDWHVHEMAFAGRRLYKFQDDYTGLVALDPRDPDTCYFSTDADPVTGDPLVSAADGRRHYEIFRGKTADFGASWAFSAITANSTTDQLRPTIPRWEGHTALLWLRGRYKSMLEYEQDVVGIIDP